MVSVSCIYFIGAEKDAHKYRFGGNPEGTLELYDDHIDVFKKSKAVSLAFGVIGSALEGKGKPEVSIPKVMITNYIKNKNNKYVLYLRDGNVLDITITGLSKKESIKAMDDFLNNDYRQDKKEEIIQNNNTDLNKNEDQKENKYNSNKVDEKFIDNVNIEKNKITKREIEWKCDKCGTDNSGKFCINCGEKKSILQEKIENNWECSLCGTRNFGKFCTKCGHAKPDLEKKLENRFCSRCGQKVEKDYIYCYYCGNKIM